MITYIKDTFIFFLQTNQSENFSGATTAVPVSANKKQASRAEEDSMDALQKAIASDNALSPAKGRGRKKVGFCNYFFNPANPFNNNHIWNRQWFFGFLKSKLHDRKNN